MDLSEHTKVLLVLEPGVVVQVQNQTGQFARKWDLSGTVVERLGYDSYLVRMDGSGRMTKRNRRFLRPIKLYTDLQKGSDRDGTCQSGKGQTDVQDDSNDKDNDKDKDDDMMNPKVRVNNGPGGIVKSGHGPSNSPGVHGKVCPDNSQGKVINSPHTSNGSPGHNTDKSNGVSRGKTRQQNGMSKMSNFTSGQ